MAEETKNPEVELDTDGVNEETVNVEAPKEVSNESFEKKQDVDLRLCRRKIKAVKELLKNFYRKQKKKNL